MSPRSRRRILALSIPLITLGCVSLPPEPEFYPPPAQCPPGDRTDWRFDAARPVATKIRWVVLSAADRDSACRASEWAYSVLACAYVFSGAVGVVYATMPRWQAPEWLREHEDCHTQGWHHEQTKAR